MLTYVDYGGVVDTGKLACSIFLWWSVYHDHEWWWWWWRWCVMMMVSDDDDGVWWWWCVMMMMVCDGEFWAMMFSTGLWNYNDFSFVSAQQLLSSECVVCVRMCVSCVCHVCVMWKGIWCFCIYKCVNSVILVHWFDQAFKNYPCETLILFSS